MLEYQATYESFQICAFNKNLFQCRIYSDKSTMKISDILYDAECCIYNSITSKYPICIVSNF